MKRLLACALLLAGCGTAPETTGPWTHAQADPTRLDEAFAAAGDNLKELQAALSSAPPEYREAMEFLVGQTAHRAFMPDFFQRTPDATFVTAALLRTNVELAYRARAAFPWGGLIDEDTFRRFVLPYRMTTEKPDDWRTVFWSHPELRPIIDKAAADFQAAPDDAERSRRFRVLIHALNTDWVGKKVPYAPRGMPDHNPLQAIENKTGRCTDETNTLIGVLRTFGIAATGVRSVWWPEAGDNHTWTAVYDPVAREWLDVDSGQGGEAKDPAYFRRFIRDPNKKAAKIYWVVPGEEAGDVRRALALKDGETYPPGTEKYLINKPMVDRTERYADVADLTREGVPADTLIWLSVRNSNTWRPVAGMRSTPDGKVTFPGVGVGVRYRLMTCRDGLPAFCSEVLTPRADGAIASAPGEKGDEAGVLDQFSGFYWESGRIADARRVLLRASEIQPKNKDILYNLACACSLLGRKDEAIDHLAQSLDAGWINYPHINTDKDLDNIRREKRFIDLINARDESVTPPLPEVARPAPRAALNYAIVVSKATREDKDWSAVVDAFQKKYRAEVFVHDGIDPAAALQDLVGHAPRYVAFIARPDEATRRYAFRARQIMRGLDKDPYEDAVWGIITGYEAGDCLRMAAADKLVITKPLSAIADGWLSLFREGTSIAEGEKNTIYSKAPGKPVEQKQAPDDTTKAFVDALNSDQFQMMSTTGHATDRQWLIGYGRPNGTIFSRDGRLFGRDLAGKDYPITTTNSKIYYSPGNCLIGHISGPDCMALAWLHSGANQFFGHTYLQYRLCWSWAIVDYFMRLQGRFTFAESTYLSRANIQFRGLVNECCKSTVFYGDPAWEARVSPEIKPPYEQSLEFRPEEDAVTATLSVTFNQDYEGPVVGAFFPRPILNPKVESTGVQSTVLDNAILVDVGRRKNGERIVIVVRAKLEPLKEE